MNDVKSGDISKPCPSGQTWIRVTSDLSSSDAHKLKRLSYQALSFYSFISLLSIGPFFISFSLQSSKIHQQSRRNKNTTSDSHRPVHKFRHRQETPAWARISSLSLGSLCSAHTHNVDVPWMETLSMRKTSILYHPLAQEACAHTHNVDVRWMETLCVKQISCIIPDAHLYLEPGDFCYCLLCHMWAHFCPVCLRSTGTSTKKGQSRSLLWLGMYPKLVFPALTQENQSNSQRRTCFKLPKASEVATKTRKSILNSIF